LTKSEAKARAEKWRKQGSSFYLEEIPVIYLERGNKIYIAGECFSKKPLAGLNFKLKSSLSGFNLSRDLLAREISIFVLSARFGFLRRWQDDDGIIPRRATEPMYAFKSFSSGPQHALAWSLDGEVDKSVAQEIIRMIKTHRSKG
jgi:hypothetical protein